MIYEFRCKACGHDYSVTSLDMKEAMERQIERGTKCGVIIKQEGSIDNLGTLVHCGGQVRRVFSFSTRRSMPEHYNQSAGTYVSSERQLRDAFKAQSEAATIRTGLEHNFVPVDPRDKERLGVTSEGLRETYDRRKALDMPIPDVVRPENVKD